MRLTLTLLLCAICYIGVGQTSSFTFSTASGTYCAPQVVQFTNTSSGAPLAYFWDFGNGQISTAANPAVTYATAGSYTVTLQTVFDNESASSSQQVNINPAVTVSISADRPYLCQPGVINFTATATGAIANYSWDFGDGSTTTTTINTTGHNYAALGSYTVRLIATAATGCAGSASTTVNVMVAPLTGTVSPRNGCIPTTANFTASATIPAGTTVTNYRWDYGDGTIVNTAVANSSHTYIAVGTYNPTVVITTSEGCTSSFNFPAVAYGTPPTGITASSDKPTYCGSETPLFTASAVNATDYVWDFGDGTTATTSANQIAHKYTTLGTYNATVTPRFNGCPGAAATVTVNIVGVIASFNYLNSCTDKRTFTFTNTSQGNQSSIVWDFGDGSPTASTTNVTHTYPAAGSFVTTLTITDNVTGCIDVASVTIYTATPNLLNPDVAICRNDTTTFTVNNVYANPATTYEWHVLGLPIVTNTSNVYRPKAIVFGNFSNNFVIIDNGPSYCRDTIFKTGSILVRGPNLSFSLPTDICLGTPITITNTSSPYIAADSIRLYYWNYGNSPANDTTANPPPITYTAPGTYNVKLFARDLNGCVDSLITPVLVRPVPFNRILPRADTLCLGQSDTLRVFHEGTILWSPASVVNCATCDTVLVTPSMSQWIYATATGSNGCTTRDSSYLQVFSPFVASAAVNPVLLCAGDSAILNVNPPGKRILWTPAAGLSSSTTYNPSVIASPGFTNTTYTAMLTDSVGCFSSSTSINIILKSSPLVNAGPDRTLSYGDPFTISPTYSSNVVSYMWTPTAAVNCINCPVVTGNLFVRTVFAIKVTSDSGCVSTDTIVLRIECVEGNIYIPTAFTPNGDNVNDVFYPITRGVEKIKSIRIYNRYGKLVHEKVDGIPNNKSFGWNGLLQGVRQETGAYVYVMEFLCEQGETFFKKGSVVLLR